MRVLRIDDIIRRRGITESMLADMMGVSPQSVNSVVRCRENTSRRKLMRYAQTLGVDVDDLFEEL